MAGWETYNLPANLQQFGFVGKGDFLYCIGGMNVQTLTNTNVAYRFNLNSKSWQNIAQVPIASTWQCAYATTNKIVVTNTTTVYIYDIASDKWAQGQSLPARLVGGFVSGDDIYCILGSTYDVNFYVYNVNQQSLISLPQIPSTMGDLVGIGDNIYASRFNRTLTYIYNKSSMTWEEGPTAPINPGWEPVAIENKIYWSYGVILDTDQNTWEIISSPISGQGRGFEHFTFALKYLAISEGPPIYIYDISDARLSNLAPSAGFIDEKKAQKFSWDLVSVPSSSTQQSAVFQWRVKDSSTINTINLTTANSVTLPANTLPDGNIEWRVSAVSTNGISVSFTPWIGLTTIDQKHGAPTNLYPNAGMFNGSLSILFQWIHHSPISTPQAAFEIEVTYNGGITWVPLSGVVHSETSSYLSAPNALAGGNMGWRVRTYNSDDVPSDWSAPAFIAVVGAPPAPSWRSVESGKSRPLCEWLSQSQSGFQLRVMRTTIQVFDSGEIYGAATVYRIPEYLPNGQYTFQLRVKGSTGVWSKWADYSVLINAQTSLRISLVGVPVPKGASLSFGGENQGSVAMYYILRDGVPVARLSDVTEWTDYMVVGEHRYVVRVVDNNDNFVDSNIVAVTTYIDHATLALADNPAEYLDVRLRLNERPRKSQEYSMPADESHFEGREYPVYSVGPQRTKKQEISFTTRTDAEWNALFELIRRGEPIVYRDLYGTRIIGFVPQMSIEFMRRQPARPDFETIIDHTVTIYQIDYREAIAYD